MKKGLFNLLNCKLTNLRKSLKFPRSLLQGYIRTMKKKKENSSACIAVCKSFSVFQVFSFCECPHTGMGFLWCGYLWAICSPVKDPSSIFLKLISINWPVHQAGRWWSRCLGWPSIPSLGWTDICLCLPQKSTAAKLKLRSRSPSTLIVLSNVTLSSPEPCILCPLLSGTCFL